MALENRYEEQIQQGLVELFLFIPARQFLFICMSLAGFLAILCWLLTQSLALTFSFFLISFIFPPVLLKRLKNTRVSKLVKQLPDASIMLGNHVSSGGSLNSAFDFVAANAEYPLSQELGLVMRRVRLGWKLNEALQRMAANLENEQLERWVCMLTLISSSGGQLAKILELLANNMRLRSRLQDRVRSLSAQGNMQGKVMSGLPFLLFLALYMIESEAITILINSTFGALLMGTVIFLVVTGQLWMRKLLNVRVPL
ncbi:type II secretion system F family protein [Lysobacter sp. N42]|uniref:type II secretion system F family protein n=1 Tax=Lysobacter sp. N42 TaxID=2545719 RepID=UPI0014052F1B|nr:type II secretion system F family protein [Lysobacter sp. N42]